MWQKALFLNQNNVIMIFFNFVLSTSLHMWMHLHIRNCSCYKYDTICTHWDTCVLQMCCKWFSWCLLNWRLKTSKILYDKMIITRMKTFYKKLWLYLNIEVIGLKGKWMICQYDILTQKKKTKIIYKYSKNHYIVTMVFNVLPQI
jgi:hypothetical protein